VLATVLMNVRDRRHATASPLVAYSLDARGEVAAAALRVPPWPLLASELDASAARSLVELLLTEDPYLPGANGPPMTARAIAAAWAERTGGTARCRVREAMPVLREVRDPPRPARGRLRVASTAERSLLIARGRRSSADRTGLHPPPSTADAGMPGPPWRRRAAAHLPRAPQRMLFTDLANPTSKKIYAEVGFRRYADWEEQSFESA
jgi:hypothetical protein